MKLEKANNDRFARSPEHYHKVWTAHVNDLTTLLAMSGIPASEWDNHLRVFRNCIASNTAKLKEKELIKDMK